MAEFIDGCWRCRTALTTRGESEDEMIAYINEDCSIYFIPYAATAIWSTCATSSGRSTK